VLQDANCCPCAHDKNHGNLLYSATHADACTIFCLCLTRESRDDARKREVRHCDIAGAPERANLQLATSLTAGSQERKQERKSKNRARAKTEKQMAKGREQRKLSSSRPKRISFILTHSKTRLGYSKRDSPTRCWIRYKKGCLCRLVLFFLLLTLRTNNFNSNFLRGTNMNWVA
jgi:hypothetical protein